ncbi:hypothetical protein [Pelagibaculum spongiae]|nr:hypothetical protein [Pelagibaculum spongiae]
MKLYLKPLTVALTLALAGCGAGSDSTSDKVNQAPTVATGAETVIASAMEQANIQPGVAFQISGLGISKLFVDADGDKLEVTVKGDMANTVAFNDGVLSGTVANLKQQQTIILLATDPSGASITLNVVLPVVENRAPTAIENASQQLSTKVSPITFNSDFSLENLDLESLFIDADKDELTIAVTSPAGLQYSEGTLSGNVSDVSVSSIEIQATDTSGAKVSLTAQLAYRTLTAIDGYLQNAKICVDTNADNACADDEFLEGSTDSIGRLTVSNVDFPQGNLIVVAEQGVAIDSDNGDKVLSRTLMMQAEQGSSVISPMTDLILRIAQQGNISTQAALLEVLELLAPGAASYTEADVKANYVVLDTDKAARIYKISQALASVAMNANVPADSGKRVEILRTVAADVAEKVKSSSADELSKARIMVTIDEQGVATIGELDVAPVVAADIAQIAKDKAAGLSLDIDNPIQISEELVADLAALFGTENLTFTVSGLAAESGLTAVIGQGNTSANALSLTGTPVTEGQYTLVLKAESSEGFVASVDLAITIISSNQAPTIDPDADSALATALDAVEWAHMGAMNVSVPTGLFSDPEGDELTIVLSDATVKGLSFDAGTSTISGIVTQAGADLKIELIATDSKKATAKFEFELPELVALPGPTVNKSALSELKNKIQAATLNEYQKYTFELAYELFNGVDEFDDLEYTSGNQMVKGWAYKAKVNAMPPFVPGSPAQVTGTLEEFGTGKFVHIIATSDSGATNEVKFSLPEIADTPNSVPTAKSWAYSRFEKRITDQLIVGVKISEKIGELFKDIDGPQPISITLKEGSAAGLVIKTRNGDIFLEGALESVAADQKIILVISDGEGALEKEIPVGSVATPPAFADDFVSNAQAVIDGLTWNVGVTVAETSLDDTPWVDSTGLTSFDSTDASGNHVDLPAGIALDFAAPTSITIGGTPTAVSEAFTFYVSAILGGVNITSDAIVIPGISAQ